jgi:hypothetical protein
LQQSGGAIYYNGSLGAYDISYNSIRTASDTYVYAQSSVQASRLQQRDGTFRFFTAASGTAGNAITFTQAMTLDASRRLMIDTTTIGIGASGFSLLNVGGAQASSFQSIKASGGEELILGVAAGAAFMGSYSNTALNFRTNNTNQMTLDASGRLLLGTTSGTSGQLIISGNGSTQNAINFVDTNGAGRSFIFGPGIGSGTAGDFGFYDVTASQLASVFTGGASGKWVWYTNGSERARIDSVGNVLIGGTAARGTTVGTKHLDLFDGTAPAGTLTNGVSLYSSSGDLKFMNAAGDAFDVGYRNIPQNSQSANYTLVLGDAGDHIFHPVGDNNARTFTIPANSSVAFPIGTAITFINMAAANVTIAITTDTMYLSSAGTTGSRTLAQYGSATAIKITSTNWLISGSGLT